MSIPSSAHLLGIASSPSESVSQVVDGPDNAEVATSSLTVSVSRSSTLCASVPRLRQQRAVVARSDCGICSRMLVHKLQGKLQKGNEGVSMVVLRMNGICKEVLKVKRVSKGCVEC